MLGHCAPQLASAAHCSLSSSHSRLAHKLVPDGRLERHTSAHGAGEASTSSSSPTTPSQAQQGRSYEFTYYGSDGRMKATFEQAFKAGGPAAATVAVNNRLAQASSSAAAPWGVAYQMSEKNLVWSDELKSRLLQRVAARELGKSDEEVEQRLVRLTTLLPSLRPRLASMRPDTLAALAGQVDQLAGRLVQLKNIFPGADVGALAGREPALVLGFDMQRLARIAEELRALLPHLNIDRLVEENPAMLDLEGLKEAMAEAARILPSLDVQQAMASNPQLIFSFQRGSQLIPYDPPDQPNHGDAVPADDDEYAQYYR